YLIGGTLPTLKINFKRKKIKKESHSNKAGKWKTERKRNKSRRVAGQKYPLGEGTIFVLPLCRSLLVGCAVAVRLIFASFFDFFNRFQLKNGYKKHVRTENRVFLVCFPLSAQNSLMCVERRKES